MNNGELKYCTELPYSRFRREIRRVARRLNDAEWSVVLVRCRGGVNNADFVVMSPNYYERLHRAAESLSEKVA